jgi:hypothetical protein
MAAAGNEGLAAGKQMLGGFFGTVLAAALPEDDAGKKLHELIVELVGSVSVKSSGATVEIAAARPKGFDNLPSNIVAAANAAEKAASAARRESRLWQVGTALTDHAIRDRRFPAAASYSPEGKPLLSWRVALLPLLGYSKLHAEFHHDEPWNSEHNLKLLEKLPTVYGGTYQDPRSEDVPDTVRSTQERPADGGPAAPNTGEEQGKPAMAVAPGEGAKTPPGVGLTRLVVLVGLGTAFERTTGVKMQDLTDGLSNVVLIVEAPQDRAVPWTKPADLAFDPANPLAAIGGKLPDDGLMIVFADGRVETLDASTTTAEQFKALVSIAGGESNER